MSGVAGSAANRRGTGLPACNTCAPGRNPAERRRKFPTKPTSRRSAWRMKCPKLRKMESGQPAALYLLRAGAAQRRLWSQGVPAWQLELEDRDRKNTYVRVDETGEQETTNDPRDTLASEMADLKSRKIMGEQKQRMLREEAARRGMAPSGRSVRTTSNRGTFFSAYDDRIPPCVPWPRSWWRRARWRPTQGAWCLSSTAPPIHLPAGGRGVRLRQHPPYRQHPAPGRKRNGL